MCSDPIEITKPDGTRQLVACDECNDCIVAYKNDWIARGVAEATQATEVLSVTLTYRNNPDGTLPDGALAFDYSDIRSFKNRLRQAYKRRYGERGELRFIVCGEKGSKTDRVHWHMLVYCDRPVSTIGKWLNRFKKVIPGLDFFEVEANPQNIFHWSLWPHGHCNFRVPDQGGIAYVLKYAMKDKFNVEKSKGTMREHKAETHAAGYFRGTMHPPLGVRWLNEKCNRLEAQLAVPTNLKFTVPGYSGYWWPKDTCRKYLLSRLRGINEKRNELYGQDCPQWGSLLSSVVSNEKDWEYLYYGEIEEDAEQYDAWEWQDQLGLPEAQIRRKCGHWRPCGRCKRGLGKEARKDARKWYTVATRLWVTDTEGPTAQSFEKWYRARKKVNPFCGLKHLDDRKAAFKKA